MLITSIKPPLIVQGPEINMSTDTFVWLSPTLHLCAGDYKRERTVDDEEWYPRVVSTYGLTERVHWSRHLEADADHRSGQPPATAIRWTRPVRSAGHDYYGSEDVDRAFLQRKPVSFAIFGKPGLADDRLATMLSTYWGCVHVSPAIGLLAASHRPGDQIGLALRCGEAVNAASASASLIELLGIRGADVQERGYVLTGLPRHDPGLSACEQMNALFASNPPDVLIYMSCRNQDLIHMHNGLTLESMEHDHLTQTLHLNNTEYNHMRVHWYNKSLISKKMIELDLKDYENYSLKVIDEIVKQFDPTCVITVDGRKPVNELFETIKSKLMTMPLHYTVLPEIVEIQAKTGLSEDYTYGGSEFEFESESNETETVVSNMARASDTTQIRDENEQRKERLRMTSEFGRLCPVNFSNGRFVLGSDRYCIKYMGKLYYFAGPDEMQSFGKYPRQFLKIPTHGLPIRAMFYGPKTLTNPAAKAVRHLFGYNTIDVGHIIQIHVEDVKREYSFAIVESILKTAQEVIRPKQIQTNDIDIMRNAIADWTRLQFGVAVGSDLGGVENYGSEYETNEDFSNQSNYYFLFLWKTF
uniref:Adenylate kinase domain-containing protein 1 n=1 Tax=Schizaphis graminum TaxID=13262 RepID=A0A2S2PMZ3_SCHGA